MSALLVAANARVGYAEMALAAQAGTTRLEVFASPRLAILSTGDELTSDLEPFLLRQRSQNTGDLLSQVSRQGQVPVRLAEILDRPPDLR